MVYVKFVVGIWFYKYGMFINIIVNFYGGMGWRYECICIIEGGVIVWGKDYNEYSD